MKTKLLAVLVISCILFTSCNSAKNGIGVGLKTWIDAPLDGMNLPLAPYSIVFHGNDQVGIKQFEISINNIVVALVPNSDSNALLASQTWGWQPQEPGRYVIGIRAQNSKGSWSEKDIVTVTIGVATLTPTIIPTTTLTPTPTLTITPTPTGTPTKTATPSITRIQFLNPSSNIHIIYTGGDGCGRDTADLRVTIPTSSKVEKVSVNIRLINGSKSTNWISLGMALETAETWLISVTPEISFKTGNPLNINDYHQYNTGEMEYQFVAVNMRGTNTLTSEIYQIALSACDIP